jgi:taurine dioxygenase
VTVTDTPTLTIERVSPTIGAEISGVDLRDELPDETIAAIRAALLEHKVLFLRDQPLTQLQHLTFGRRFGDLEVHPITPADQEHPEIFVLRHDENHRGVENTWHSDVTWRPEPSMGSILRARVLPEVGGDTLFADMHGAYEGLSDKVRHQIDGLVAIHDFTRVFGALASEEEKAKMRAEHPSVEHTVVRTHPETGLKGIYVNRAFTVAIKGMAEAEGNRLLEHLYRRASIPEHQCRLRWRPDTIAFWDNRSTQHYAVSDYWPAVRVMERVTVVGDRPY